MDPLKVAADRLGGVGAGPRLGQEQRDYLRATSAEERRPLGRAVGLILAEPGQPSLGHLMVDLVKGQSYIFLCNLRDAPDKPSHNMLGMGKALTIK